MSRRSILFFFQAEDGIRDVAVTGVQTCALPIFGQVVTGSRNDASFAVALNCGIGSRFFECTRERVGETPRCPRTEFLDLRIEVQIMDPAGEMLGNIQLAFHKGPVYDELRGIVWKTCPLPDLDLFPHRLEVPLHTVYANREDVHKAQVLGVLSKYGRKHA